MGNQYHLRIIRIRVIDTCRTDAQAYFILAIPATLDVQLNVRVIRVCFVAIRI